MMLRQHRRSNQFNMWSLLPRSHILPQNMFQPRPIKRHCFAQIRGRRSSFVHEIFIQCDEFIEESVPLVNGREIGGCDSRELEGEVDAQVIWEIFSDTGKGDFGCLK